MTSSDHPKSLDQIRRDAESRYAFWTKELRKAEKRVRKALDDKYTAMGERDKWMRVKGMGDIDLIALQNVLS